MLRQSFLVTTILFFSIQVSIAQSKKQQEVATAVEQLRKGMVDGDSVLLSSVVSDDLSYGHSGGHVEGKAEFVRKIVGGQSDFVTIDLANQTISVKDKTAIVRHDLNAKTNDNGKPNEVHLHILLVWQKQHGSWQLVARQAVKKVS
ncbi:MAG: nuclear transport factor 2 family protein [Ferruginibacter sp.]|nr:nuclear transport factor 2 family protein [Ferruginibacter sp.]